MRLAAELVRADPGKRLWDRLKVAMRAEMRQPTRRSVPVTIIDLSARGCRFETPERLSADANLWLRLPGLEPLYSRVAWVREWEAGCEFDHPLHPAVVDRLVQSSTAANA